MLKHEMPHAFYSELFELKQGPNGSCEQIQTRYRAYIFISFFPLERKMLPNFVTLSLSDVILNCKEEINTMIEKFVIYTGYFTIL